MLGLFLHHNVISQDGKLHCILRKNVCFLSVIFTLDIEVKIIKQLKISRIM